MRNQPMGEKVKALILRFHSQGRHFPRSQIDPKGFLDEQEPDARQILLCFKALTFNIPALAAEYCRYVRIFKC